VNQIIHRIGTSGIPVTETRAINYRESTFIEVKLWSGRFTLSHERYQALGMIDVLSRSSAHRDGYPAALLLVTAADTVIGRALLREATRQRVLVFQARLLENQNATTQGGPNIRIDTPVLLNPSVLIGSTISAVVPPLTVPPPAAVRWP